MVSLWCWMSSSASAACRLRAASSACASCCRQPTSACKAGLHASKEGVEGPLQQESCLAWSPSGLPQMLLAAWRVVDPSLEVTACTSERLALSMCLLLQTLAICLSCCCTYSAALPELLLHLQCC